MSWARAKLLVSATLSEMDQWWTNISVPQDAIHTNLPPRFNYWSSRLLHVLFCGRKWYILHPNLFQGYQNCTWEGPTSVTRRCSSNGTFSESARCVLKLHTSFKTNAYSGWSHNAKTMQDEEACIFGWSFIISLSKNAKHSHWIAS